MCILSIKRVTVMSNTNTDKQEEERKKSGVANLRCLFTEKKEKDKKEAAEKSISAFEKEKARIMKEYSNPDNLINLDDIKLLDESGIIITVHASRMPHLSGWVAIISWDTNMNTRYKMLRVSRGAARTFKSIDTIYTTLKRSYTSDVFVSENFGERKIFSLI